MNIQSDPKTLQQIFYGLETKYTVPKYQRRYAWVAPKLDELWSDCLAAFSSRSHYFMGVLVLHQRTDAQCIAQSSVFNVVDGQQRLATFTILFSVLRNYASQFQDNWDHEAFALIDKDEANKRRASDLLKYSEARLYNETFESGEDPYLVLSQKDNSVFRSEIILSKSLPIRNELRDKKPDSRIVKAKKFFMRAVQDEFLGSDARGSLEKLKEFAKFLNTRIQLLFLQVSDDADAYSLFEALNSKGLSLSAADLIKNQVLAQCSENPEQSERVYQKWSEVEEVLSDSRFDIVLFIRAYWIAFHQNVSKNNLYRRVKGGLQDKEISAEGFVDDLLLHGEFFADITNSANLYPAETKTRNSSRALQEINTLRYSICYPALLVANSERELFVQTLARLAANFLFRVITIGERNVGIADSAFARIIEAIKNIDYDDEELEQTVREILSDRDIEDYEFKEKLTMSNFDTPNLPKFILAKVFEHEMGEALNLNMASLHLEHILPQSWIQNWREFDPGDRLSPNEWVYCLGNMVILEGAVNQKASNKRFQDKVVLYKRRSSESSTGTAIPSTYKIHEQFKTGDLSDWTKDEILSRANDIAEKACEIWTRADRNLD